MGLDKGENVYYSVMPEITRYSATVASIDDNTVVLQTNNAQNVSTGKYIVISGTDFKYYTEIINVVDNILTLKQVWEEKRGYFRVDDVFPVVAKKIERHAPFQRSKIFRGYDMEMTDVDLPDETINPKLWKMLVDINAKLQLILERLLFESEGLIGSGNKIVNLSASGIRFTMNEKVVPGDKLEIKMLLPTGPPIGILTYGNVVKVNDMGNDQYEIALHFSDIDNEVREEIIQYTINRQREMSRKEKQQKGSGEE